MIGCHDNHVLFHALAQVYLEILGPLFGVVSTRHADHSDHFWKKFFLTTQDMMYFHVFGGSAGCLPKLILFTGSGEFLTDNGADLVMSWGKRGFPYSKARLERLEHKRIDKVGSILGRNMSGLGKLACQSDRRAISDLSKIKYVGLLLESQSHEREHVEEDLPESSGFEVFS